MRLLIFSLLPYTAVAHSWLGCTDYAIATDEHRRYYDDDICHGYARCGDGQARVSFGIDTGFNYQPGPGGPSCQCERESTAAYTDLAPAATYTPGQLVCLAYPPKNHVSETCGSANAFIPDNGVRIYRSTQNANEDPLLHNWPVEYTHQNGLHQQGVVDYKGFQNCPAFCEDNDKALCTMCFQLEGDIQTGSYTFQWEWQFNPGEIYTSCWDVRIEGSTSNISESDTASEDSNSVSSSESGESKAPDDSQPDAAETAGFLNFEVHDGKIWANDQEFYLKGVNWFGFEEIDKMLHGLWGQISLDEGLDFIAEHNFNAIRIPFSVSSILENPITPIERVYSNPELEGLTMLQVMEVLVEKAAQRNLLIMFDAHRLRPESGIDELWYDDITPVSQVKAAWSSLTETFCSHWNVFAADLKNEPHGIAEWGTGSDKDWKLGAQDLGDFVLSKCPRWLIFVEGVSANVQGYESEFGWWGGLLQGVHNNPVHLSNPSRLVYSPHVYGPGVAMQPEFSTDFPEHLPIVWDADFGFVPSTSGHAIVIGEWGGVYEGMDKTWQDAMFAYIRQRSIGYFYWSFNPNSADTGGLVYDDWHTPVDAKLQLLQPTIVTMVHMVNVPASIPAPGT